MTTPERHEKVYELFVNARKLDDAARAAYLAKACADDPSLREEVEALLAQGSEMTSFLEQPPAPTPLGSAAPDTLSSAGKPPATDSPAGDALAGIIIEGYEILRELHRGGQGVVFQAIQKATKRKVAIKVLREGPYASKSAKKRFEREIELVAQLKHPNIIAIFDSGTTADGWQYCAMDYVRGTQLNHHIRENKLTLEETLNVFKQVCDAVQYAHYKGVIHRDLKPSNILVDSEGNAKVLDFGLAKQMVGPIQTVVSITQEIIGTLPYMSPEQARGNPDHIDTRTDIYALGVILYEILTGHYPYPVVGQMADVLKHIAETPPIPPSSQWTPDSGVTKRSSKHLRAGKCPIDDELQTVILKTLAKERERRYQSAGDLAKDISHYLANEPIEAKRDSGWYVLKKAVSRHKMKIGAVAAFLALMGLFGVTLLGKEHEKQSERLVSEGQQAEKLDRWATAWTKYDEALRLNPDNYLALCYAARWKKKEYFRQPNKSRQRALLNESIALSDNAIERAKEIDRSSHALWNMKSEALMALGELQQAEQANRRALALKPDFHEAKGTLAKILALQGKYEEALEVATQAANAILDKGLYSKYTDEVWRALGSLQLYLGDPQALESLGKAKEIQKKDFRNSLLIARAYLTLRGDQNNAKALHEARVAAAYTGLRDPRFKRILAQAQLRNGQFAGAATNAEAAKNAGDLKPVCLLISAIAQAHLGRRDDALRNLDLAEKSWPESFKSGEAVIVTADEGLLWFDTAAELESLRAEAQLLLESEPR